MVNKMFELKELKIPKDEVLRYLGYKKKHTLDDNLEQLINETIEESYKLLTPKFVYAMYNNDITDLGIVLCKTKLVLTGNDIYEHLKHAKKSVIMAVTVGRQIETKIKYYEKINLTKALILDACATSAVEEVCDRLDDYIKAKANEENLSTTFRFSPGYGDLPLDIQRDFINTLNAEKTIGLTVSEHNLLMPRKSVTAIIGLIPKKYESKKHGCEVCKNYQNCSFRKDGGCSNGSQRVHKE